MDIAQNKNVNQVAGIVAIGICVLSLASLLPQVLLGSPFSDFILQISVLPVILWGFIIGVRYGKKFGFLTLIVFTTIVLTLILMSTLGETFLGPPAEENYDFILTAMYLMFFFPPALAGSALVGVLFANCSYSSEK